MRSILSVLVGRLAVAALFCLTALGARAQPLPSDPALVTGELDNGLRYALRHNAEPRGRISARLAIRVALSTTGIGPPSAARVA